MSYVKQGTSNRTSDLPIPSASTYSCGYFCLLPTPVAVSVFYLLLWLFLSSTYSCGYFCFRLLALVSATSPFPRFKKKNKKNQIFSIKISTVCMALAKQLGIVDDSDDLTVGGLFLRGDFGVCTYS